jgi:large subunit ribosomal protein L32
MAVPKKKTSKSKRNMRRAHDALKKINVIIDKDTGEYRLPHHIDASSGAYNNKQIVIEKTNDNDKE